MGDLKELLKMEKNFLTDAKPPGELLNRIEVFLKRSKNFGLNDIV